MTGDLIAAALANYGPPGMLLAYMVWAKVGDNRLAKERIAADLEVARALTMLSARIEHVR